MSETQQQTDQQQSQSTDTKTDGQQQQQSQDIPFYNDWKDDELKTSPIIHRHKTTEDLARSLVAAEKRLGVPANRLLVVPEKADDAEGMSKIYKALGGPENVDGYKLNLEGATEADATAIKGFAEAMHKAGPYPPKFVEGAVTWFREQVAAQEKAALEAADAAKGQAETMLKEKLGAAYEQTKAEVGKLISDIGGPELVKELDAHAFGDSPQLSLFLAKIAEKVREPGPNGDAQNGDGGGGRMMTPEAASARAKELEAHPALRDRNHAQHADIVKQRNDALRMAEQKAS